MLNFFNSNRICADYLVLNNLVVRCNKTIWGLRHLPFCINAYGYYFVLFSRNSGGMGVEGNDRISNQSWYLGNKQPEYSTDFLSEICSHSYSD
jgi:hypothetical protein